MTEEEVKLANPLWFREDKVFDAFHRALVDAVAERGDEAKAFAWDVNITFKRLLAAAGDQP